MYNLALDPSGASSTYDVSSSVTSHTSGMTFSLPQKKGLRKPGSNGLKVLAFDYMTFPEDVYTIKLVVKDNLTGAEIARTSIFEVVQPPPPPPPVTVLTEDQAKRGNRMLKFLASKRDMSLYDKLGLEGKTEFLINFWKERDPTPDTPENEFMIVFNERFSFADFQLGGAESDRGHVFIKYGQPEDIERNDSETNMKSFQIWYYTSGVQGDGARADDGGRQYFVFGDRRGIGRYELLHSSARGEISNPDWRSLLLLRQDLFDPNSTQFDPSIRAGKLGESGANRP
jgi:GWxTD domain-containing protein